MKIQRKTKAIIYVDEHGKELAALEYKEHQNVYYLMSTYVDPSLRGQGIAGKLLDELIVLLEEKGATASPVCSYSVSWFQKHPEYEKYLKK
ncbi:putative GNAT family acetyltransferase [Breznakia sp. PF5-3]|uniref:GNAT family N-acetyltransferase n=1 Tax=unclassified Breznakia TaxID=2623764 RepID=UPI0024064C00|nr:MULTISPECIES: GNAT family N-acetyltransferase [unclassified Breznakia]MDF9824190.1 putative GNAT family acetyltransferase [Breznakia sp. PM6-1]MDF9834988.1 putative GNAT family acetyltransferase [Breznakia sp. PF5-3]MDF9837233.1 putative GNAT family acetyltransferase [Breznakia sp. PFB2-8]MDF9859223.1 putative GNAT family acetyltransferase [Breznakia sp. PH5-24]